MREYKIRFMEHDNLVLLSIVEANSENEAYEIALAEIRRRKLQWTGATIVVWN